MKVLVLALLAAPAFLAAAPALAQQPAAPQAAAAPLPDSLKAPGALVGYALGLNIGVQMKSDGVSIDADALARGLRDGMSGAKPLVTGEQMSAIMAHVQAEVMERRQAKASAAADANRSQGAAFLKANSGKPVVVTLPSGLQYQVLKAGTGPRPKPSDTVLCNYRGTLIDGTEFDSSYGRGQPSSFPVDGVIKGWTEALQLMPVGSTWRIFVPAALAYGDKGAGDKIGPGAVLIFEIQLVSIG